MNTLKALQLLKKNTFTTVGCTDPVAIGLAVAWAREISDGRIKGIKIRLDRSIYKDALFVPIPGTNSSGVKLAAAIAAINGSPENGLELFKDLGYEDFEKAHKFMSETAILFEIEESPGIFISAMITTDKGRFEATISGSHDRLVEKRVNGNLVYSFFDSAVAPSAERNDLEAARDLTIEKIFELVGSFHPDDIAYLVKGVGINSLAGQIGLGEGRGIGLGRKLKSLIDGQVLSDSLVNRTRILVAAAADARMGGLNVPIWGCFGSGNHGITFFITVGEVARRLEKSEEELAKALALGLLVIGVVKSRTGILTPHCGCAVSAGTGASAAITYLLGGDEQQVENSIHLMSANLAGMICDGAKGGCSLKISTSAGIAIESAFLASLFRDTPPSLEGIVGRSFQETMFNIEKMTHQGLACLDKTLLEILLAREEAVPRI